METSIADEISSVIELKWSAQELPVRYLRGPLGPHGDPQQAGKGKAQERKAKEIKKSATRGFRRTSSGPVYTILKKGKVTGTIPASVKEAIEIIIAGI